MSVGLGRIVWDPHTPFIAGFTVYESFESVEVAKTGIVPDAEACGADGGWTCQDRLAGAQFVGRDAGH